MVKADPKRNYYADLELGPTATTDDIKKQFRNLGSLPACSDRC
jgi:curved DNA-binding protein CbpA